jgi:hypothetical protein
MVGVRNILGVCVVVLSGCGTSGSAGTAGSEQAGATTTSSATSSTEDGPIEEGLAPGCDAMAGVDPVEAVASATGHAVSTASTWTRGEESGCALEAGPFTVSLSVTPLDPAAVATTSPMSTVAGIDVPHHLTVTNDRSGLWWAHGGVVAGDHLVTLNGLSNGARGSDTYPAPEDGSDAPAQEPLTRDAAIRLLTAFTAAG